LANCDAPIAAAVRPPQFPHRHLRPLPDGILAAVSVLLPRIRLSRLLESPVRIADGKIVEGWQNWDMLGLMQQIQSAGLGPTYLAAKA